MQLDEACLSELRCAAEIQDSNPLQTEVLHLEDFDLPTTTPLMAKMRQTLNHGTGFTIIDRLPVDVVSPERAPQLYRILMNLIAQPVAQKWDGTVMHDIQENGVKTAPGNGSTASKTNQEQGYHTRNVFNLPQDFVAPFCTRPAVGGGESGIVTFASV